jgi:alkylation response protein AidB-like acyl-CoA dehydrogenase
MTAVDELHDPTNYAAALREWIAREADALAPYRHHPPGEMEDTYRHELGLVALLDAAGWSHYGWPTEVGGRGGSAALRAVLYDEVAIAGYVLPEAYLILETLGPMLVTHAPAIAAVELPRFLAAEVSWCQGFSEPDAGSDLAALRTRADELDGGFRLSGQKTWVSFGSIAQRSAVLTRTGTPESRHRGLTMFWVDLEQRGIEVRGIRAESDRNEFAELFFDDVFLGPETVIGGVGSGWAVAMYLLQFERGMYAWQRQAFLHSEIESVLRAGADLAGHEQAIGDAYLAVAALRERCRSTVRQLAAGENPGPETSVDKLLLAAAEQTVFDRLEPAMRSRFVLDDDDRARTWRTAWLFARAASIYGGAMEVQRDIVAEHLLGLRIGGGRGR